jgi:hypothetical protein
MSCETLQQSKCLILALFLSVRETDFCLFLVLLYCISYIYTYHTQLYQYKQKRRDTLNHSGF